jgi:hypothetical protein
MEKRVRSLKTRELQLLSQCADLCSGLESVVVVVTSMSMSYEFRSRVVTSEYMLVVFRVLSFQFQS